MNVNLKALAVPGARTRLAEVVPETDALLKALPEVNGGSTKQARRSAPAATATPVRRARRKKYHMSPEQRAAVSARMTAYWSARRKTKK